jgi:hypothetical protein
MQLPSFTPPFSKNRPEALSPCSLTYPANSQDPAQAARFTPRAPNTGVTNHAEAAATHPTAPRPPQTP